MTLAAAWIESTPGGNSPLCFASDSRTTPGPIEGVTKVMLFGRDDLAGVWAGDYRYAMLITTYLDAVFTASDAMRRRDISVRQALSQARGAVHEHLKRSMNPDVRRSERVEEVQRPEPVVVLVGGYSVLEQEYYVLSIEWLQAVAKRPARWKCSVNRLDASVVLFIGDELPAARLRARNARDHRVPVHANDWRMEPLASIYCACVDESHPSRTIGGALQLAKTFRHGSARAYAVDDSLRGDSITFRGAAVNPRARRDLDAAGLIVSLECWNLETAYFGRGSL